MRRNPLECEECQEWADYREACNNPWCAVGKKNIAEGTVPPPGDDPEDQEGQQMFPFWLN